jgi:hypothetical protein
MNENDALPPDSSDQTLPSWRAGVPWIHRRDEHTIQFMREQGLETEIRFPEDLGAPPSSTPRT